MKNASMTIALLFLYSFGIAQNRFQNLIQRIALLEVYLGYLKSGYKVVKGGLNTFRDLKNGEFELHKNYFDRMSIVNPKIKQYSKVAGIIGLSIKVIKENKEALHHFTHSGELTDEEIRWLGEICNRFMDDCTGAVDLLMDIVSDSQLKLTDDQRLLGIDNLHKELTGKARFCRVFISGAKALILERIAERNSNDRLKNLYEIK